MSEPRFEDDASHGRYRLLLGDDEVGYIEYDPIGKTSILIKHTEVRPGHEGQGYGSTLVQRALDLIREQGKTAVITCPYALAWVRRHPEYLTVIREDQRKGL